MSSEPRTKKKMARRSRRMTGKKELIKVEVIRMNRGKLKGAVESNGVRSAIYFE